MSEDRTVDGGSVPGRPPRRDEVMDALGEAYARDEIGMEELERRLDEATRAASSRELLALVRDLDPAGLPASLGGHGAATHPTRKARDRQEEGSGSLQVPAGAGKVDPARVPDRQFEVAVFSGRARTGSWVPARTITAVAFMGGMELDFREALFGAGVTEVHVMSFLGGVEIVVPPGLHLETSGFAVLGGFEDDSRVDEPLHPDAPTLRVRGFAFLGGVDVSVRLPGESPRDAKRRRKQERRKRLGKGQDE